ncbi:hypothetical protein ACIPSA_11455 [Streptomyces sp. NPDC086549]|uniref:hypothetical protein n=1 Tax=Streptomyces sp. NPDC086549 TaxID=3365752 RepID=UPI00381ADFA3
MSTDTVPRDTTVPAAPTGLARLLERVPGRRHRPPDGGSTTARELALRRRLLLGLTAALTLSLFVSYEGVHGDADPLRTSSAPAVLSIAAAQHALGQAQREATATPPSTSGFQEQISVAAQSLAAAASDDVGGPEGQQALQTVAGLITVYDGMVQKAQLETASELLRDAYLTYAKSVLDDPDSGITTRLDRLQDEQRGVVKRQTSFGWALRLAWGVAALLVLALVAALLETHLFLRGRFRRRYNRQLLAAGALLVAGFVTLVLFTVWTHGGMAQTRALLDRRLTGEHIIDARRDTATHLAHTGFRAAAAVWIVIGGLLLMTLAETGLRQHINDYRFRPQ